MTDRQFTEDKLVIATHNVGKMREIEALFASFDLPLSLPKVLVLPNPKRLKIALLAMPL